jgi:hypothetical protein
LVNICQKNKATIINVTSKEHLKLRYHELTGTGRLESWMERSILRKPIQQALVTIPGYKPLLAFGFF